MENFRGAALMTLAMLGFAFEDMLIKFIADDLPPWQIILLIGAGGALVFALLVISRGEALLSRDILTPAIILRNVAEMVGTIGFVSALALAPLSLASAILQAAPLVVTLGAAVLLKETVGWRRWSAVIIGFVGVLMVIQPGFDGFDPNALLAVIGVLGLGLRDLAIRRVSPAVSSFQLSFLGFFSLVPAGLILAAITGQAAVVPSSTDWVMLAASVALGVCAYFSIVLATRIGEVSFVTPFRYSRMLFALLIGTFVFSETLNALMLAGTALIVASGVYTLLRERKLLMRR